MTYSRLCHHTTLSQSSGFLVKREFLHVNSDNLSECVFLQKCYNKSKTTLEVGLFSSEIT